MLPGMNRNTIAVAIACSLASAAPASADVDYAEVAAKAEMVVSTGAKVGIATVNRVRRSIAFGPHAGTYAGVAIVPNSQLVSGITFGMALYTFDIPTILDIDKLLKAQLEIAIRAEASRIIAEGGKPDIEAIARTAYANLKEDIMGKIQQRTLEKPKLGVILEGMAQLQPGNAMGARLSVTKGIGPVSLGLGAYFLRGGGNTAAFVGPDLSLRLTPWGKSWTPVIDIYARLDVGFDEGERPYVVTVGGRMLLDLI
jgi:hypothetical protein